MNQASSSPNLSIMFADVAGSTRLYDALGDAAAEKCINECLAMMSRLVKAGGGLVVKTIGDEVMARFDDPNHACNVAKQIQLASEQIKVDQFRSIKVRIGMHSGQVIEKENDIFGDAVNIAARMSGIAKAEQIIISEDMHNLLDLQNQESSRFFDRTHVKGKEKALGVYQIIWEEQNHTNILTTHGGAMNASNGGLMLIYNGKGTFISNADSSEPYVIGRDASCNLMVNSNFASRNHLDITWKRDKFILTDQSTNGTMVTTESGEKIYLKRESFPLIGKGSITLGVDDSHVISFDVLSKNS